jgi:enoyl-CoA hydratase
MTGAALVLAERDGDVGICILNRPDQRNALSTALLEELVAALDAFDADPAIRAIVIRGEGKAFAAGADLDELARSSGIDSLTSRRRQLWGALQRRATPTIAACHGWTLGGGCELALACDILIASEDARFGLPETGLGIIPGAGGTQRLVRAVGKAVALDVILAGRMLNAEEAVAAGLAARCVATGELIATALAIAHEVARRSPIAQTLARDAVLRALDVSLEAGLELERDAFCLARSSADADEGIAAFREKRQPTFEGR